MHSCELPLNPLNLVILCLQYVPSEVWDGHGQSIICGIFTDDFVHNYMKTTYKHVMFHCRGSSPAVNINHRIIGSLICWSHAWIRAQFTGTYRPYQKSRPVYWLYTTEYIRSSQLNRYGYCRNRSSSSHLFTIVYHECYHRW
jgi:hypothetical protein